VSPTVATTYTVTVSDGGGCSKTDTKLVNVENVQCGMNKVTICMKTGPSSCQTACVASSSVPYYILFGAKLGACGLNTAPIIVNKEAIEKGFEPVKQPFTVRAYPNPSKNQFVIETKGLNLNEKAELVIYDAIGQIIEIKSLAPNQTMQVGANYKPGVYIGIIKQGKEKLTIRLIKQSQ
jgi:hypothetical protein